MRAGGRIAAHVEIDLGAHAQVEWHELILLDARQTPLGADRPAATLRWDVTREGVPLLRQLVDLTSAETFRDAATAQREVAGLCDQVRRACA